MQKLILTPEEGDSLEITQAPHASTQLCECTRVLHAPLHTVEALLDTRDRGQW